MSTHIQWKRPLKNATFRWNMEVQNINWEEQCRGTLYSYISRHYSYERKIILKRFLPDTKITDICWLNLYSYIGTQFRNKVLNLWHHTTRNHNCAKSETFFKLHIIISWECLLTRRMFIVAGPIHHWKVRAQKHVMYWCAYFLVYCIVHLYSF